jgi:hypothetical protein
MPDDKSFSSKMIYSGQGIGKQLGRYIKLVGDLVRVLQVSGVTPADSVSALTFVLQTPYMKLQGMTNGGIASLSLFIFKNNNDRMPYFDIRYSLFQSFFFRFGWTPAASGDAYMKLRIVRTVNRLNVEH